MQPSDLTAASFNRYPPQARQVAAAHLTLLQHLPLSFLHSLLRELIDYDESFPAEQARIGRELTYLGSLTPAELTSCFAAFASIHLSPAQLIFDWLNQPLAFSEQLSAFLWSTHQMDAFRAAATAYGNRLHAAAPTPPPPVPRLGIAVIGHGVDTPNTSLFRHLRQHGTYFTDVDPTDGLNHLLAAVEARAATHPTPYAHWYIDGTQPMPHSTAITSVSYADLAPVRNALLSKIQSEAAIPGMGPEKLRDDIARLTPSSLGMRGDALLDRFQVRLLTEGSGTQIFSTTFAQWTTREVLRRAEALTLLVRYAPTPTPAAHERTARKRGRPQKTRPRRLAH